MSNSLKNIGMIDRRNFLSRSGAFAAVAALSGPLVACGDAQFIVLPDIGIWPEPAHVPGVTYIHASEIGCALDCDLTTGRNKYTGGQATDDGPRINAALANASANNPITLIIDGSALVSGLFLPADGSWSIAGLGSGTGFFIKSGTNNDGIHNGDPKAAIPSDPGPPVPARGKNVSLQNFILNGNQGNGRNGVSTTGATQGILSSLWYFSINLMNLDNVTLQNIAVVNAPSYHVRLSNVGNVNVSNCIFRSHGPNTDGLHFDGPANDIKIDGCDFVTGDDSIALNCPEGYSGNISNVEVTNCTFKSWILMRLYTINGNNNSRKFEISNVAVTGCSGRLDYTAFLFAQGSGGSPASISGVTISKCNLTAPSILDLAVNFGDITLSDIQFTPVASRVNPGLAFATTSSDFRGYTYTGSKLTFQNCTANRTQDFAFTALIIDNASSIGSVVFNGYELQDQSKFKGVDSLVRITSGSVGGIVINAVDSKDIPMPVADGGISSVRTVSGTGVLGTKWPFPDVVMADGVPYISSATGLPSIKVNGVVQRYPGQ